MNKPLKPASPYKPVRAVSRAFELLFELSRAGRARPAELATATGLDRATVYRLLATLAARDLVRAVPASDAYEIAAGVQHIADGYQDDDRVARIIAQEMSALMGKVRWPSEFGTFENGAMHIREDTHRYSAFSVDGDLVGVRRSLFNSAIGRAALAWASDEDRRLMIRLARQNPANADAAALSDEGINALVQVTRRRGYAEVTADNAPVLVGVIALPAKLPAHPLSALNIVFYRSVMTTAEAARDYLDDLRATIAAIEEKATRVAGSAGEAAS